MDKIIQHLRTAQELAQSEAAQAALDFCEQDVDLAELSFHHMVGFGITENEAAYLAYLVRQLSKEIG